MPTLTSDVDIELQPPLQLPNIDLDAIASLILYGLGIGFPIIMCGLPLCCWWWRSQTWKMRDCWCCKRFMRTTGVDSFDDFEVIISVHEAHHPTKSNGSTSVSVRAGTFEVETDVNTHSNFQQSFVVVVEQGTEYIEVDLLDQNKKKMATLKLDPVKDVLAHREGVSQKQFNMRTSRKGTGNARITLSLRVGEQADEERGLLKTIDGNPHAVEVEFLLREQLRRVDYEENAPPEEQLHTLASACTGPVDYFSYFGVATPGVLAVIGPPARRRWTLGFWKDPADFSQPGDVDVDLMRISSVQEDPGRSEVFVISYLDVNRVESRVLFRRTDRARDVWVHLLTMHISALREMHQQRQGEMSMRPSKSKRGDDQQGSRSQRMIEAGSQRSTRSQRSQRSNYDGGSHVRARSERGRAPEMHGSSSHRISQSASRMHESRSNRR